MNKLKDLQLGRTIYTDASVQSYITTISKSNGSHVNAFASPEELVKDNLLFVVSVAKYFTGYGVPLADLIQYGNIGIIKASNKYDPTKGFTFPSYAVWWIRQSIIQGIKDEGFIHIPENKLKKNQEASKELEKWMQENGLEISQLPDVETFDIDIISTDTDFDKELVSPSNESFSDDNLNIIEEVINHIVFCASKPQNEREQKIIFKYIKLHFFDGYPDGEARSFIENDYSLSSETIRRIVRKCLDALKTTQLVNILL